GNFSPVEALQAIADMEGLHFTATQGVERAKLRNGDENPRAGQPNGRISVAVHTEESLASSKRGRRAMDPKDRETFSKVTSLLRLAMQTDKGRAAAEKIVANSDGGE